MRNPDRWSRPWADHYRSWLERLAAVEELGAEIVWLTEHHLFDDGHLPQCWTLGAAIAARTERMRIGTAVSVLPLHAAIEVAEQVALVDVISGGRVEPGFGVGYRTSEYHAFGVEYGDRYRTFEDSIRALRTHWREQAGPEGAVTPAPLQTPVPMWGGFRGPIGARLSGRLGLGLLWADPALVDPYLHGLADGGHDLSRARMAGVFRFLLTDDPERTWARAREHVEYRWNSYHRHRGPGVDDDAPSVDADRWLETGRFVLGTVDEVARTIERHTAGMPITDVICWGEYPGLAGDIVDRHLELAFTDLRVRLMGLTADLTRPVP